MEYFIFNGINSNDKNILIKEMPPIIRASQRINSIKLEGRSGTLHEIEDKFDSYKTQIKCIALPNVNIDELKKWLIGSGKMILSTNLNVYYNVVISNKIDFSKYLTYLKEFPIEIEVQPISYGHELKQVNFNKSSFSIEIGGNYKTYPLFKVIGNGKISCNNKSITVFNNTGEIYIDCELLNAYFDSQDKNDLVEGLEDPIYLNNGENTIEISGLTGTMYYREAWL